MYRSLTDSVFRANCLSPQAPKTAWDAKVSGVEKVYGSAAAMSLSMDRALLAQFQRGPGLESSFCGLDTFLGRDDKLGFEDYLNRTQQLAAGGSVFFACCVGVIPNSRSNLKRAVASACRVLVRRRAIAHDSSV